ncbi:MAG: CDP-diacylglycerol--glycerol-3-phosphate 3-phosphatidyltransferase [Gaiellaceae bacterium]
MATRAHAVPAPLAQLPNALTILRLILVPVFVVLMLNADDGYSWTAGIIFAVAAITDQIDGFLARRWHVESEFGKVADPLADRLMIDAAIILLWAAGRLPFVALALILVRDGVLLGGYRFFQGRGIDLNVSLLGKVATWILYASLCLTIVTPGGTDWPLWLFWVGLLLSLAAGAQYVVGTLRDIRARPA